MTESFFERRNNTETSGVWSVRPVFGERQLRADAEHESLFILLSVGVKILEMCVFKTSFEVLSWKE